MKPVTVHLDLGVTCEHGRHPGGWDVLWTKYTLKGVDVTAEIAERWLRHEVIDGRVPLMVERHPWADKHREFAEHKQWARRIVEEAVWEEKVRMRISELPEGSDGERWQKRQELRRVAAPNMLYGPNPTYRAPGFSYSFTPAPDPLGLLA